MPKYLAKYTVNAYMFDGGCWMKDPEPHKPEYSFEAKDDEEAQKLAEERKNVMRKDYFGPKVTLESLLQIKEVTIEEKKDAKVKEASL